VSSIHSKFVVLGIRGHEKGEGVFMTYYGLRDKLHRRISFVCKAGIKIIQLPFRTPIRHPLALELVSLHVAIRSSKASSRGYALRMAREHIHGRLNRSDIPLTC
jgi:hypothetical protein